MKKVIILILGVTSGVYSFEPPQLNKEKERKEKTASTSSRSSSGSQGEVSSFEPIPLDALDMSKLDTDRMEKEGKIVISNIQELDNALKARGVVLDEANDNRRISIVYLPNPRDILPTLNLSALQRDISNQSRGRKTPDLERGPDIRPPYDQPPSNFDKEFAFFVQYMREKTNNPELNLKSIEEHLKKDFKEAHNTPPSTPNDSEETHNLQKKKKTVEALRKASLYQETARVDRQQKIPQSPALTRARDPRALEILHALINDKDVHDSLEVLKDQIIGLLDNRTQETEKSLTNTRYGGIVGALLSAGVTALITYLGTKKSC